MPRYVIIHKMPTLSHLIMFNNQKNTAYTSHPCSRYRKNTQHAVFANLYLPVKDSAKRYLYCCFKHLARLHRGVSADLSTVVVDKAHRSPFLRGNRL
jgi:hypothetical protein